MAVIRSKLPRLPHAAWPGRFGDPGDGNSPYRLAFWGFLAALALIVLFTFLDYGLGWDEEVHRVYGDTVMRWYQTLGQDKSALFQSQFQIINYGALNIYGAFFEIVAHVTAPLLATGLYEGRHLVSAGFGILGVFVAYLLGSHLAGPRAGFFSALLLALTPPYYGHMFFNPKDTPFAALYLLAIYAIVRLFDALPRPSKRAVLGCGAAIGVALGVRVGGVLLFSCLVFVVTCWVLLQNAERGRALALPPRQETARLIGLSALIAALAWGTMLVFWPWAQVNPIANPLEALRLTIYFDFARSPSSLFFEGNNWPIKEVPQTYLPTMFAVSLPEFYFVAFGLGSVIAGRSLIRRRYRRHQLDHAVKLATLGIAAGLPLAAAVIRHSVVYDGLRLFLFVLPPLAVLAGVSVATLLDSRRSMVLKLLVGIGVTASAAVTVADMAKLHPYEYVYFNRIFGGGEVAAARRFETDYWGVSYKEGVRWLIDNYHPNTRERIRVANCSREFLTGYFLQENPRAQRFVSVKPEGAPHVYVATTRFGCHAVGGGTLLHVVERAGVPLLYIREVQRPEAIASSNSPAA